jgi:hypothetical protein
MKIVTVVAAFGLLLALVNADPVTAQEQVEERRPFAFEASQAFGYDDNLMRLPDAALLPGFATDRGSALSRTRAMATFDQTWSLQRVRAAASGEAVRFGALSAFDHEAYEANGRWDWAIGRPWFGTFELGTRRFLSPFLDARPFRGLELVRNLVDLSSMRATGGMRWTPQWSGMIGVDQFERNNSDRLRALADLSERGYDFTLRWASASDLEGALRWRRFDGRYANRQVFDLFGDPIPGLAADNAFTQEDIGVSAIWDQAAQNRLEGALGHVKRSFPNLTQRNFAAPYVRFSYTWRPGVKLSIPIAFSRDVFSLEQFSSTFMDTRRVSVNPTWDFSAKRQFVVQFERELRAFKGDASAALGLATTPPRSDATSLVGLRVSQELMRQWLIEFSVRAQHRESNLRDFQFNSRSLLLALRWVI